MGRGIAEPWLRHPNQVSQIRCRNGRIPKRSAPLRHLRHPLYRVALVERWSGCNAKGVSNASA
jgi:hypothetical protein